MVSEDTTTTGMTLRGMLGGLADRQFNESSFSTPVGPSVSSIPSSIGPSGGRGGKVATVGSTPPSGTTMPSIAVRPDSGLPGVGRPSAQSSVAPTIGDFSTKNLASPSSTLQQEKEVAEKEEAATLAAAKVLYDETKDLEMAVLASEQPAELNVLLPEDIQKKFPALQKCVTAATLAFQKEAEVVYTEDLARLCLEQIDLKIGTFKAFIQDGWTQAQRTAMKSAMAEVDKSILDLIGVKYAGKGWADICKATLDRRETGKAYIRLPTSLSELLGAGSSQEVKEDLAALDLQWMGPLDMGGVVTPPASAKLPPGDYVHAGILWVQYCVFFRFYHAMQHMGETTVIDDESKETLTYKQLLHRLSVPLSSFGLEPEIGASKSPALAASSQIIADALNSLYGENIGKIFPGPTSKHLHKFDNLEWKGKLVFPLSSIREIGPLLSAVKEKAATWNERLVEIGLTVLTLGLYQVFKDDPKTPYSVLSAIENGSQSETLLVSLLQYRYTLEKLLYFSDPADVVTQRDLAKFIERYFGMGAVYDGQSPHTLPIVSSEGELGTGGLIYMFLSGVKGDEPVPVLKKMFGGFWEVGPQGPPRPQPVEGEAWTKYHRTSKATFGGKPLVPVDSDTKSSGLVFRALNLNYQAIESHKKALEKLKYWCAPGKAAPGLDPTEQDYLLEYALAYAKANTLAVLAKVKSQLAMKVLDLRKEVSGKAASISKVLTQATEEKQALDIKLVKLYEEKMKLQSEGKSLSGINSKIQQVIAKRTQLSTERAQKGARVIAALDQSQRSGMERKMERTAAELAIESAERESEKTFIVGGDKVQVGLTGDSQAFIDEAKKTVEVVKEEGEQLDAQDSNTAGETGANLAYGRTGQTTGGGDFTDIKTPDPKTPDPNLNPDPPVTSASTFPWYLALGAGALMAGAPPLAAGVLAAVQLAAPKSPKQRKE